MKAITCLVIIIVVLLAGGVIYYFYVAAQEKAKVEQQIKDQAELAAQEKAAEKAAENITAEKESGKEMPTAADTIAAAPPPALTPERDTRPTIPGKSTAASNMPPSFSRVSTTIKVPPSKKVHVQSPIEGPGKKTGPLRDDIQLKKPDPTTTTTLRD